jgi:SRSO17 transposase
MPAETARAEQAQDEELRRIGCWAGGLDALHARIAPRFRRPEVRARARRYLAGLLGRAERKNGWQLAEETGERHPRGVQRLLDAARWDAEGVRDDLRGYVVEHLGDPRAVLVVDETGFLKKGTKSVGVQRQYSGTAGRRENCQVAVFLCYAAPRGRAFLDRALYLPRVWADDAARRTEAGVPPGVGFATKPQLAKALLARAFAAGVPAAWVAADTVYGQDGRFRHWLETERRAHVLAVPRTHRVWRGERQATARAAVAQLPAAAWARRSAGEGAQGPRWYDWAWLPLSASDAAGWGRWLLARRSVSDPREVAYYRVFAPAATPLAEAVRAAGSRWAIEEGFEQAKGEVGLDQYEVRRWEAWHRHVTLALLAHAYLEVTRCAATSAAASGKGGAPAPRPTPCSR